MQGSKKSEAQGAATQFPTLAVSQLRPNPRAAAIYGTFHGEEDSLLESIRAQGILTPLLVTDDGLIVAGNERLRVARLLNIKEAPVQRLALSELGAIEEALLNSNVARHKTNEQRLSEYRAFKAIEAAKATRRKGARTDLLENLPAGGERGAARDLAAARVGWSGKTAEAGLKVVDALDQQAEAGANMQEVEQVRTILNAQSVDAAYRKAVELAWIPGQAPAAKQKEAALPASEKRVQAVFQKASAAAAKLAEIVGGDEVQRFNATQTRQLRLALEPLLRWLELSGVVASQPACPLN